MGKNFFEQELRKIVEPIYPNASYAGRFCFVPLGENNCARISLERSRPAVGDYDVLQVKILNKNGGELDCVPFHFLELFKVVRTDEYLRKHGKIMWRRHDSELEWYVSKPTKAEYSILTNAVKSFTELFLEQTQEQVMTMQQGMMM